MALKLEDKWLWDSWYAHDGEQWHGFFLQADKSLGDPDLRHMNVTQAHAVSKDLTHWDYLGTCFAPARTPAWDDYTTWTGSVIKDHAGLWHLFYTGTSRAENGLYQRIGHATSADLHHWNRVGDTPCLDLVGNNADLYETHHAIGHWHDRAMRDPWVMPDPEGKGWLMYFTARTSSIAEANGAGTIGFATSDNLYDWVLQPPVFTGGFGQLEVPQVFQHHGYWYCLFCTAAQHWSAHYIRSSRQAPVTGSHYLIADHPRGPWRIAPGDFLDGAMPCRRYAARILAVGKALRILGFADGGKENFGGYIMDPQTVEADANGLLHIVNADENRQG